MLSLKGEVRVQIGGVACDVLSCYRGAVVAHKTFHRYTVRAKRGTAQSVKDGQQGGHQPK